MQPFHSLNLGPLTDEKYPFFTSSSRIYDIDNLDLKNPLGSQGVWFPTFTSRPTHDSLINLNFFLFYRKFVINTTYPDLRAMVADDVVK